MSEDSHAGPCFEFRMVRYNFMTIVVIDRGK